MKKDKTTSIRINSKVFEKLKDRGLTPQKIFDEALKKYVEVKTDIKVRSKK